MPKNTSPRRWFQIHLSTGIALMFVAGGLMWLNDPRIFLQTTSSKYLGPSDVHVTNQERPELGWPWRVVELSFTLHRKGDDRFFYTTNNTMVFADAAFAILILIGTAYFLERRIRAKSNLTTSREGAQA